MIIMYLCNTSFLQEYCEMMAYNEDDPIVCAAIHESEIEYFFFPKN